MSIKGKVLNTKQCEVFVRGKFTQIINSKTDVRAKSTLEFVHIDLAGTIEPDSREGCKYALSFTDYYSSVGFVYFLKHKRYSVIDVESTERFWADMAPYKKITCIGSDNSTEFTGQAYHGLHCRKSIRHEMPAP